jgi:drug/metabolite transporter (DMT)-like permease
MTRRGWLLFIAMCVIWGLPYLFIRIAVDHLSPATLVGVRTAAAAVVLMPIALARHEVAAVLARWRPLVLFAVIEIMIPWLMLNHAEQRITSSLAGLLVAAVPLFGALAFLLTAHAEKFTARQVGGLALGFLGVTALVGIDVGQLDLLAIAEMLVVAVCYAAGPIILTRSLADFSGLAVMACSLTLAALVYAPAVIISPPTDVPGKAWLSVGVLALVCTAVAFVLFAKLIAEVGPTRATIITYVNPAVALALGVVVLDEQVTTGMMIGFPLILAGCIIAAGARRTVALADDEEPVPAPS